MDTPPYCVGICTIKNQILNRKLSLLGFFPGAIKQFRLDFDSNQLAFSWWANKKWPESTHWLGITLFFSRFILNFIVHIEQSGLRTI